MCVVRFVVRAFATTEELPVTRSTNRLMLSGSLLSGVLLFVGVLAAQAPQAPAAGPPPAAAGQGRPGGQGGGRVAATPGTESGWATF